MCQIYRATHVRINVLPAQTTVIAMIARALSYSTIIGVISLVLQELLKHLRPTARPALINVLVV
jgi:hypothetical protein